MEGLWYVRHYNEHLIILLHVLHPFKPNFVCAKLFSFPLCSTALEEVSMDFDKWKRLLLHFKCASNQDLEMNTAVITQQSEPIPVTWQWASSSTQKPRQHYEDLLPASLSSSTHTSHCTPERLGGVVNRAKCCNSENSLSWLTYLSRKKACL